MDRCLAPPARPCSAARLSSAAIVRNHRHVEVDVWTEELDDHQVLAARVLDDDRDGSPSMGYQQLVLAEVARLDLKAVVQALAVPDQNVVHTSVNAAEQAARPHDQLLAAELGGVVVDPVLLAAPVSYTHLTLPTIYS